MIVKLNNLKLLSGLSFLLYFRPHWPIAILYFHDITHSLAAAGAIFSIVFIAQALLEVPTGLISDYIGRKKTMIGGALFYLLAIISYAIGMNFWVLAFGALLEAISRALFSGTRSALLYETVQEEGRGEELAHLMGRNDSLLQIGLATSAAFGGLLALHSLSLVFWVAVIPQIGSLIIACLLHEPRHIDRSEDHMLVMLKKAWQQFMSSAQLRLISLAEIIEFGFGEAMFYFQAAFFKMLIPEWAIGFVKCLTHTCSAISFWYSGRILKRFGSRKVLISGTVIQTTFEYIALLIPTVASPIIMALNSLTFGVTSTARSLLMQEKFTDQQRATMDSMVSLSASVVFGIVSILLGWIADISSPIYAMLAGGSSSFLLLWIYRVVFKEKNENIPTS